MSKPKFTLTLDKEREILFNMSAIAALDEQCGINLFDPTTYSTFTPAKVCALIWAGQLCTDKPLKREAVGKHVPTSTRKYYEMVKVIAEAVRDALKDDDPPQP